MPSEVVEVRAARVDDVPAIARFQTDAWNTAYAGIVPQAYLDGVTAATREARWRERVATGSRLVVLAVATQPPGAQPAVAGSASASLVVGVASAADRDDEDPGPRRELKSLYVARSHHGTGLAARLVQVVIGNGPAVLWVFRDNPRAIAFYAKIGFRPDGLQATDEDTGLIELRLTRSGRNPWGGPASPPAPISQSPH